MRFRGRELESEYGFLCPANRGKHCPTCQEVERKLMRKLQIADEVLYYIKTHGYAPLEAAPP